MFENFLSVIDFPLLEQGYQIGMDWLGQFARVIIEGCGIIGLGIIVFTLVLKAITLPFDIYQRVKMRKQNLIMRDMKDDLEKLQKQYANDKNMYNQKMMELYKKNGYSMMGACLPMIISFVILIVAFQGFRSYSQYANLDLFVGMSESYNAAILENGVDGTDFTLLRDEEGQIVTDGTTYTFVWYEPAEEEKGEPLEKRISVEWKAGETLPVEEGTDLTYTMSEVKSDGKDSKYLEVRAKDKYVFYIYNLDASIVQRQYKLDTELLYRGEAVEAIDALAETIKADEANAGIPESTVFEIACTRYAVRIGALAAKEYYHAHDPGFLWVRNVWYPDVSYNHPVPSYSTFKSQLNVNVRIDGEKKALTSVLTEPLYNNLTSELAAEKSQPNGYFILIVLSIGMMALSQFLTMRSQKESNQYQTVDGQGARTQKIMLVMMPLIYAVFAFMYSAAFSIYMTVSSAISLIVTLLSNYFIGLAFKKKEEKKIKEEYGRTLSWMTDGKKGPKNKKSKGKDKTDGRK